MVDLKILLRLNKSENQIENKKFNAEGISMMTAMLNIFEIEEQ